ncbi:MAG: Holliday junction branch migration protein RuvA [Fimbriimonadaceae bacterium]|nr:Holliday junction branch migration protein RuvA [Fimbriimonadaceae bacterium]
MIGRLRGELLELGGSLAVVDAGGVGYEVQVPESLALAMPPLGERVDLFIRQIFREDGTSLYGFADAAERRLFDVLLGVKGCGPRVVMALLGQVGGDAIVRAVAMQDARTLSRATGVGLKLAERIILETKDKIAEESLVRKVEAVSPGRRPPPTDEVVEALLALGFRRSEAEAAAREVPEETSSLEERVRLALRSLSR